MDSPLFLIKKPEHSFTPQWTAGASGGHSCGGGGRGGVTEGAGEVHGELHQLIGISDVCQAVPEDGPLPFHKTAVTVFEIPAITSTRVEIV